ncbi:oxidative stress defense protein [Shewanella waksmanii]|uniref:oxidative stress defense protein n=1 Tax=Shewanella waksmanii TaxID=213783 RepID=UPI003734E221
MKTSLFNAIFAAAAMTTLPFTSSYAAELTFPHIETIGTSQVSIAADTAIVNVEVVVKEDTASAAKRSSDTAVAEFIKRLKAQGIAGKDIQSANIRLSPRHLYDAETRTNKEVGYQARRQVTVTVTEIDKLNAILDSALANGINKINHISFKASKEEHIIAQARSEAIKDAQQKAQALAAGFDRELDGVWQIRYYDQRPVQPAMYRMNAAMEADVAESYQQAQTTISDRVEVIYRLK